MDERTLWSRLRLGSVVLVLATGACAESTPATPKDPGIVQATANAPKTCPLGMAGTQIAIADPPDGVDVAFTTKGDVAELRARVGDQAAVHGPGQHHGLGHGGIHEGAHTHGLRLSEIDAPLKATFADVAGGATIHIVPERAADLAKVRAEVHERAAKIVALGECP